MTVDTPITRARRGPTHRPPRVRRPGVCRSTARPRWGALARAPHRWISITSDRLTCLPPAVPASRTSASRPSPPLVVRREEKMERTDAAREPTGRRVRRFHTGGGTHSRCVMLLVSLSGPPSLLRTRGEAPSGPRDLPYGRELRSMPPIAAVAVQELAERAVPTARCVVRNRTVPVSRSNHRSTSAQCSRPRPRG